VPGGPVLGGVVPGGQVLGGPAPIGPAPGGPVPWAAGGLRRLDARSLVSRLLSLSSLRQRWGLLVALLAGFGISGRFRLTTAVLAVVAVVAVTLGSALVEWIRFEYAVADGRLVVQRGLLQRSLTVVPLDRIRGVDVHSTAVQRLLGIAALRVDAAATGGRHDEAVLDAVSVAEAGRLRRLLLREVPSGAPPGWPAAAGGGPVAPGAADGRPAAPGAAAPGAAMPGSAVPGAAVPGVAVPGSAVPRAAMPGSAVPGAGAIPAPDGAGPDGAGGGGAGWEGAGRQGAAGGEGAGPVGGGSDGAGPDGAGWPGAGPVGAGPVGGGLGPVGAAPPDPGGADQGWASPGWAGAGWPAPAAEPVTELARLRPSWLLYAPLVGSYLLAPVAAVAALQQYLDDLHIPWFDRVAHAIGDSRFGPLEVAGLAVAALAVCAVGAVATAAVGNWGFTLARRGGSLVSERGLLSRRQVSLEVARIRGYSLAEPLSLRLVRAARLTALVTGLGGDNTRRGQLLPLGPATVARAVADKILPFTGELRPHPPAARRRRLLRATLPWLLLALVAVGLRWWWAAIPLGALTLLGVPLGLDRYRGLGHGLDDRALAVRSGSLRRHEVVLDQRGVVGWQVRQTFFQRRAGLATLTAGTGAGGFDIIDLAAADTHTVLHAVSPHQTAGLVGNQPPAEQTTDPPAAASHG